MQKLKSKVEICKLPSTTSVFLPRYREVRKLPPSPRWSPSQGIPRKGQAPGRVTPWIASGLPHTQVGLRRVFRQASPGCSPLSSLSSFRLKRRGPCSLSHPILHSKTKYSYMCAQDVQTHTYITNCNSIKVKYLLHRISHHKVKYKVCSKAILLQTQRNN